MGDAGEQTKQLCNFRREISTACKSKNLKSKNPNISKRNSSSALLKSNKSITTQSPKNVSSIMSTKRKIEDEETEATKKAKPTYDDEEEEEDEVEAEGEEEEGEEDEDEDGVGGVDGEDEDGEEEEDLEGEASF